MHGKAPGQSSTDRGYQLPNHPGSLLVHQPKDRQLVRCAINLNIPFRFLIVAVLRINDMNLVPISGPGQWPDVLRAVDF